MLWLILGIVLDIWAINCLINTVNFLQSSLPDAIVLIAMGMLSIALSILCFKRYKKIKDEPKEQKIVLTKNNIKNMANKNKYIIIIVCSISLIFFIIFVKQVISNPSSTEVIQSTIGITAEQAKLIEDKKASFIFSIIVIIFGLMLLIFFITMFIITSRNAKQRKQQLNKRTQELNAKEKASFLHTVGLPIAENTDCNLYLCDDKIVIDGNNMTFTLSKEKLIDVTVKSDVEIQKSYVSSLGGAVAGGLLFGAVGALIGGRIKEKRTRDIKNYLIFTYEKEGNPESIAFNVTYNVKQWTFVKDFEKTSKKANKEIEL